MKIAVVQLDAAETDIDRRWSAIEQAVAQAADRGARIVILPELAISGYGAGPDILMSAEGLAGAQVAKLKQLARDAGTALVIGLALKSGERVYNSAAFVTPDCTVVTYNKLHLYGDYENGLFAPGETASPIFTFEGLKFGLLVCFDVEFPERVRGLALRGAEAVLVPTALPKSEGVPLSRDRLCLCGPLKTVSSWPTPITPGLMSGSPSRGNPALQRQMAECWHRVLPRTRTFWSLM